MPPIEENIEGNSGDAGSDTSDTTDPNDETFDDWVEDPVPCKSLFENLELPSVEEALKYDMEKHQFDLKQVSRNLNLDFHGRARLINFIRSKELSPEAAKQLTSSESFLTDDAYLKPAITDDPLLLFETDDWSDDEEAESSSKQATPKSEIERLKAELEAKSAQVVMLQSRVQDLLEDPPSAGPAPRDDDTHYFQSYGYQDIHNIMLRDSVRTMSYAKFILSNPAVFRDKLVVDVGCGTGILSMFAARAGAKHVFAIDASDIALKARQNIKDSELDEFITVIQGKVEDIKLPAPYDDPSLRVDVIVSEWMGYALLYESMLDSVLVARDRFLKPLGSAEGSGVMAPSQCKMVMALVEATELWKEKVSFWDDVYGFKMTAMADEPFADAMIDNLPSDSIVSNLVTIKDIPTQRITAKELDFSSPFSFTVPRSKERSTVHGFVLYFDTYFAPSGEDVPVDSMPTISDPAGQGIEGDILPIGRLKRRKSLREDTKPPVEVSFSTGPQSYGTHWKQAIFLLKEPFRAIDGTTVSGTFHLKKSETNSRELDVEIHYSVSHTGLTSSPMKFQTYKVR